MRTVLSLTAGLLLALAPAGAASAAVDTAPSGNAWGNCGHSSAGGAPRTAPELEGRTGKGVGNGGVQHLAKATDGVCEEVEEDTRTPSTLETTVTYVAGGSDS